MLLANLQPDACANLFAIFWGPFWSLCDQFPPDVQMRKKQHACSGCTHAGDTHEGCPAMHSAKADAQLSMSVRELDGHLLL